MKKPLSDKLLTIKPSITLGVTAKANALKAEGKKVYSFGAGEPDFLVADPIKLAAIEAVIKDKSKYTAVEGMIELRRAVADRIKRKNNVEYDADQIIVSSGAKHSLFTALQALCSSGDEVIIPQPSWVSYIEMAKMAGASVVSVETKAENRFILQPEELKAAVTPKTKVLMLNNPSNPTGTVYTRDELYNIANICVENGIYIISDEIYDSFVYEGSEHFSCASLSDEIKDITITINGFSKTYAMPGWRLGYAAAPKEIVEAMSTIQGHCVSHPASIVQYAAITALTSEQSFVDDMLCEYVKRREYLREFLSSIDGIKITEPQGAFYYFIDISGLIGKSYQNQIIKDDVTFTQLLLDKKYVVTVAGEFFGASNFIRISYATAMDEIKAGMKLFKEFTDELE